MESSTLPTDHQNGHVADVRFRLFPSLVGAKLHEWREETLAWAT